MMEDAKASKPFHLLTPQERTALRIAQNRAIAERIAISGAASGSKASAKSAAKTERAQRPPAKSSADFLRATPEERAELKLGSVIRKLQS